MIKPVQSLQFTSNEDDVRRAALLNDLMGQLRSILGQVLAVIGDATAVPLPATTVVTERSAGQASAVGTATTYARGDHTHGTPAAADLTALVSAVALSSAVLPVRVEMEKVRVLLLQLVKLELGDELDRGVEGLDG